VVAVFIVSTTADDCLQNLLQNYLHFNTYLYQNCRFISAEWPSYRPSISTVSPTKQWLSLIMFAGAQHYARKWWWLESGTYGERVEREPKTGVWGRAPGGWSGGRSPLKLKGFGKTSKSVHKFFTERNSVWKISDCTWKSGGDSRHRHIQSCAYGCLIFRLMWPQQYCQPALGVVIVLWVYCYTRCSVHSVRWYSANVVYRCCWLRFHFCVLDRYHSHITLGVLMCHQQCPPAPTRSHWPSGCKHRPVSRALIVK